MLNITITQGNANQSKMRYHHVLSEQLLSQRQGVVNVIKDVEKGELLYTADGNEN